MVAAEAGGAVVAIHNLPEEGDASAGMTDNSKVMAIVVLGSCSKAEN